MKREEWKSRWKEEEAQAHIQGWDFSHIQGRFEEEHDLPWNYGAVVREYLCGDMTILDYDTGGGEFLLSLDHPRERMAATEGYPPNVRLCEQRLQPLGITFRECADPGAVPFPDGTFDCVLNRHGSTRCLKMRGFIFFGPRRPTGLSSSMTWGPLYGSHGLSSGNFQGFQWMRALRGCGKCRRG